MSALANHPFVKMNGLGNAIVVVDMRREKGTVTPEERARRRSRVARPMIS